METPNTPDVHSEAAQVQNESVLTIPPIKLSELPQEVQNEELNVLNKLLFFRWLLRNNIGAARQIYATEDRIKRVLDTHRDRFACIPKDSRRYWDVMGTEIWSNLISDYEKCKVGATRSFMNKTGVIRLDIPPSGENLRMMTGSYFAEPPQAATNPEAMVAETANREQQV